MTSLEVAKSRAWIARYPIHQRRITAWCISDWSMIDSFWYHWSLYQYCCFSQSGQSNLKTCCSLPVRCLWPLMLCGISSYLCVAIIVAFHRPSCNGNNAQSLSSSSRDRLGRVLLVGCLCWILRFDSLFWFSWPAELMSMRHKRWETNIQNLKFYIPHS